jgi:iron complex transport system permease protein
MKPPLTRARLIALLLAFGAGLALVAAAALTVGSTHASLAAAWAAWRDPALRPASTDYQIICQLRLPRIILAALVGGGLGLAGTAFQAILRNPLADPYTLGVASGSALGASVVMALRWSFEFGPFGSVQAASLLGGAVVIGLIYRVATVRHEFRLETLLLGGVTVALISSSAIVLMRMLADPNYILSLDRWLMGGLAGAGGRDLVGMLPLLFAGVALVLPLAGAFNQLGLGEEMAFGRGVEPQTVRKQAFVGASLITAAVVAAAGPIGFVGLIVPHAVRRLVGSDHRLLLPCAALASGAFLILCDTAARTVIAPTELPVGVVTACVGGPVFVWLLARRV